MRKPIFSDVEQMQPVGRTMRESIRDVMDRYMRLYLTKDGQTRGVPSAERTAARRAVRALAEVVALYEGGYPDTAMVKNAEKMSLDRVKRDHIERHSCGDIILVNGMCNSGHDPSKRMRSDA